VIRRDEAVPAAIRAQACVGVRSPQSKAVEDLQSLAGILARGKEAA